MEKIEIHLTSELHYYLVNQSKEWKLGSMDMTIMSDVTRQLDIFDLWIRTPAFREDLHSYKSKEVDKKGNLYCASFMELVCSYSMIAGLHYQDGKYCIYIDEDTSRELTFSEIVVLEYMKEQILKASLGTNTWRYTQVLLN